MGFVLLVGLGLTCAFFFAWGLRTPPLEQVWRMQLELALGQREALSHSETQLLQNTLVRYPDLADNMLDNADSGLISSHRDGVVDQGYAYLVRRTAQSATYLKVQGFNGKPVALKARTQTKSSRGSASAAQPFVWSLPQNGPFPQLIEVRWDTDRQNAQPLLILLRETP